MARRLAGTVRIQGVDDEPWPLADETVDKTFTINLVVDDNQTMRMDLHVARWCHARP